MNRLLHRLLYRMLPLGGYLRTVSALFFATHRLGIGRHAPATEYTFHLKNLMGAGELAVASPAATATSTPWSPWRRSGGCSSATCAAAATR